MRIIAGTLGGRMFESPHSFKTHPMSDKMRGALFNILGDIEGLRLLDAFAGSGAISFEAVSRGAASALAIDSDRPAQNVITANIRSLGVQRSVKLIAASANAWLQTSSPEQRFDIIVCDPPYNDRQAGLLARLCERLAADGILVVSWPSGESLPPLPNVELISHKTYGDASLAFYKHKEITNA